MSLSDLASLGSFVSGLAVLVSLVYLSLQTKQTDRNQQAQIRQERTGRLVAINLALTEPSAGEAVGKGLSGATDMTEAQHAQFRHYCRAMFQNGEDSFCEYEENLLRENAFNAFVLQMKAVLSFPGTRVAWKLSRNFYRPSYAEFIDRLVAETPLVHRVSWSTVWNDEVASVLSGTSPAEPRPI
jgi:hypothetical protein